jgi:hypothetical protein
LDLRIKSYEETKNLGEVWAGWACAKANQQEFITCSKKCGQEEGREFFSKGEQHSQFLNLAPTLGRVKSSIPHGAWRFHFFPISFAKITPGPSYQPLGFLSNEKVNLLKIPQELLM